MARIANWKKVATKLKIAIFGRQLILTLGAGKIKK